VASKDIFEEFEVYDVEKIDENHPMMKMIK